MTINGQQVTILPDNCLPVLRYEQIRRHKKRRIKKKVYEKLKEELENESSRI